VRVDALGMCCVLGDANHTGRQDKGTAREGSLAQRCLVYRGSHAGTYLRAPTIGYRDIDETTYLLRTKKRRRTATATATRRAATSTYTCF
jgi:hypothetical protein